MSDRYVVLHASDAWNRKLPGAEEPLDYGSWWAIWECDDAGNPVREVGTDAGEPEDKILVRDFKWVLAELNRVAALAPRSERREGEPAKSHTVCIGWTTIQRVAKEGAVWFEDAGVGLVAADDLFHADVWQAAPPPPRRRRNDATRGSPRQGVAEPN